MPTTRQNVDWIKDRNSKYSPEQILEVLDEVHYRVRSLNIDYNYYLDSTTGMPPYLVTTNEKYSYDCPDNCRKTSRIFCWKERVGGQNPFYSRVFDNQNGNADLFNWRGREYIGLNCITQQDKTLRANAKVFFGAEYNPGDTTEKYFHLYWVVPQRIESVEDEMEIPEEFSFEIRQGVNSILSTEDYGETGFDDQVLDRIAKKIANGLEAGAPRKYSRTPWRREYRDFP